MIPSEELEQWREDATPWEEESIESSRILALIDALAFTEQDRDCLKDELADVRAEVERLRGADAWARGLKDGPR